VLAECSLPAHRPHNILLRSAERAEKPWGRSGRDAGVVLQDPALTPHQSANPTGAVLVLLTTEVISSNSDG